MLCKKCGEVHKNIDMHRNMYMSVIQSICWHSADENVLAVTLFTVWFSKYTWLLFWDLTGTILTTLIYFSSVVTKAHSLYSSPHSRVRLLGLGHVDNVSGPRNKQVLHFINHTCPARSFTNTFVIENMLATWMTGDLWQILILHLINYPVINLFFSVEVHGLYGHLRDCLLWSWQTVIFQNISSFFYCFF